MDEYEEIINFYTSKAIEEVIENENLEEIDKIMFLSGYNRCQNDIIQVLKEFFNDYR